MDPRADRERVTPSESVCVDAASQRERAGQSQVPEETRIEPATRHHYNPSATRLPLSRVLIRGSIRPTWQSPSGGLTSLPHGAGFASIHWQPGSTPLGPGVSQPAPAPSYCGAYELAKLSGRHKVRLDGLPRHNRWGHSRGLG